MGKTAEVDREAFVRENKAILRMQYYVNQEKNFVNVVHEFVAKAHLREPKAYLPQNLSRAVDLKLTDKLVTASKAGHMEINERGERVWVKAIFHDLGRTASTNLLAGGMSPANVRAIVGHLSEEMTARYNKPAMATLAAQQRQGAALLAAIKPAELSENVIHSSLIVAPENSGSNGKEKPVVVYNQ